MTTANPVLEAIRQWLRREAVEFVEKHHAVTTTSEESARARGEPLSIGAKALVVKVDERFALFVLPADQKLDSQAIRRELGARKTRFAERDELLELTGLVPGSVPPFGKPILPLELYVDPRLRANDRIAFNAGSLTDSIIMPSTEYERVADARWFSFAKLTE